MKTEKQIETLLRDTLEHEGETTDGEMTRLFVIAKTLHWVLEG
jgi:hypothetical protein